MKFQGYASILLQCQLWENRTHSKRRKLNTHVRAEEFGFDGNYSYSGSRKPCGGAIMEDIITNFELKSTRLIRVSPCCAEAEDRVYDLPPRTRSSCQALP